MDSPSPTTPPAVAARLAIDVTFGNVAAVDSRRTAMSLAPLVSPASSWALSVSNATTVPLSDSDVRDDAALSAAVFAPDSREASSKVVVPTCQT